MPDNKEIPKSDIFQETDSLEHFYTRYQRFVYKLAWSGCHRPSDVEDVVQNTWEALCTKYKTIQRLSSPQQVMYITVTVKNIIRMDARKKKLDTCSLESISGLGYDGTVILEHLMDRKIMLENFRIVWQEVNPAVREILERKYILDQTDAEIASAMQIKPNSVRTYLSRARKAAQSVLIQHSQQLR